MKKFKSILTSCENFLKSILIKQDDKNQIIKNIFKRKLPEEFEKETDSYLFYYGDSNAGIDHTKSNLKFYLLEAKKLNRVCVINKPHFYKFHNTNSDISTAWTKYINFEKSSFYGDIEYIFYADFIKKNFSKDEVLVVDKKTKISDEENQKNKLIIRKVSNYPLTYKHLFVAEDCEIRFYPSARVFNEANVVLKQMVQEFCSISIRKDDRAIQNPALPALEYLTPEHVLSKLKQYNTENLPVFLMTNEQDKDFYGGLENDFKIYRYYHFENLVKVANEGDNFLLYEIEKLIFLQAKKRIHTFKNAWIKCSISDIKKNSNKWELFTPYNLYK